MVRFCLFIFLITGIKAISQTTTTVVEDPFIEVTGEAAMEILPDEIFISITLKETAEGKEKSNIENLEKDLKNKISSLGLNPENLSLQSTVKNTEKITRHKTISLQVNNYLLMVSDIPLAKKLLRELAQMKSSSAEIGKIDNSGIQEFENEIKLKAVRNAKDKADKMLGALGEIAGKLIFLIEKQNLPDNLTGIIISEDLLSIKIKLNYRITARFEVL